MKCSSFNATISALDAETSALDAETSALDAETSAILRSYRQFRRGVSGDISDCGVGITPQMCNKVTNHGDMNTFSKPGANDPAFSVDLTRSRANFRIPEILYTIRQNCYTSQGDPDSSFPYWLCSWKTISKGGYNSEDV